MIWIGIFFIIWAVTFFVFMAIKNRREMQDATRKRFGPGGPLP